MSTALNDRDAILQAASVRIINPKNASILLTASPSLFHVNAAGAVDAAATTITATLIGLEGDVTFTADGATLTGVTGKSAAVRFADMQGPAAIVTARIVAGGEPFTQSCIIGVVRDGAPGDGTPGAPGARGAGQYYAGGSAWSDGTANAVTPGDNVVSDVVTISNGGTFAMTKRWDGAAWNAIGAVFDGSLFVTGSINGAALKAGTVEIRKPDGTLILGAGGTLAAEAAAPGTKNSEIVIGGRNLFPDGDFERGIHTLQVSNFDSANFDYSVGSISGTKSLFMQGSKADMYVYFGTRVNVTPGKEYRISFYSASATVGVIVGSSSYIRLWNSSGAVVDHAFLPIGNPGAGSWQRQVVAWTCPAGVTQIEPRFGITTNSMYSWLAIDCVQIEEGNAATQWTPATEDIAADAQARAEAQGNAAFSAAVADANGKLAAKLNKGGDVLAGIFSVDTVNAPAGFRAGNLTWNAAGDRTGGYGAAMTPKGLIGYNQAGERTFMVNGQTGDVQIRGAIMGGSFAGYAWPAAGLRGHYTGPEGALYGNANDGRYVQITADGNMYMPGFSHTNGQLTLTSPIIIAPQGPNFDTFSVYFSGFNSGGSGKRLNLGTRTASITGGVAPFTYSWNFVPNEDSAGSINIVNRTSETATFSSSVGQTPATVSGTVSVTVIDAKGRSASITVNATCNHL